MIINSNYNKYVNELQYYLYYCFERHLKNAILSESLRVKALSTCWALVLILEVDIGYKGRKFRFK